VRRALTILLVLALVFAAAAVVGFWVAARVAPERLRVVAEQQLGRVLKGEVQLASLEVARAQEFPWLWLEARGARAVLKDDITLIAGQVRARLDPLSLVLGRLGIADLRIDDVIVLFPPRPDEHPERSRVAKIMRPIERVGEFLRKHPCDIPDMQVRGLTALVPRKGKLDVLLEAGDGSLSCTGLRRDRSEASLEARVRRGDETFPGEFALRVSRERAGLTLELAGAPLGALLATLELDTELSGEVRGEAELDAPGEGPHTLRVDLSGRNVKGPLTGGEGRPWLELDLERPRLTGTLAASAAALTLRDVELRDGEIRIGAEGELALPPKDEAAARLALELGPLAVSQAPRLLAQLPPAPRADAERALARIEAGRFSRVRIEGKGTLAELRQVAGRSPLEKPGALRIEATLINATVRLGEADRASGVGARLDFAGDRLGLSVTSGSFQERPLPRLELELTGISNVRSFEEVACREPQPQPPLAGLPQLQAWLTEESEVRDEEEQATLDWQRLALALDWISHPALLCSLEQVAATLEPAEDGFRFQVSRGVWAGLPVEMDGSWQRAAEATLPGAVKLAARLGPPFEAMRLDPPASPWLSGTFQFEASRMGRWHVEGAEGRIVADGAKLELPGTVLRLAGAGIEGGVGLDLGLADSLPFHAQAQFAGIDLFALWKAADFERGTLGGTLYGGGAITGQLRPGLNPLGDAKGLIAMHARAGTVNEKIPVMLAIALASDRFNPFGARDELPYDAIDAVARVEEGKLVFESLQLHAPTLRMGATGEGGVVDPYALEGVVGLFFFPGLDSLIERVPIFNRVILGKNNNLVGAYFSLTGRWDAPDASLIPIQSIATGPAGFLTEGLPGFVMGGIKRIQSVLLPSEGAALPADEGRADS
jgi:hypothetical protein